MKWIALSIGIALVLPLSAWLRRNPNIRLKVFALVAFLPALLSEAHLYMAIDSWRGWPGYVKGIEFSVVDMLALALYLSLPSKQRPTPFRFSMALYFMATVLSAVGAEYPDAALFYSWQLVRMFLVYTTVFRGVCADPRVTLAVFKGMGASALMEAAVVVWQRFGLHMLQTPGTYIHQNLLGLITHFTLFPFFSLFLGGRRGWLTPTVLFACLVADVMTTSRGTLVVAVIGLAIVFLLSALRNWRPRKMLVLLAGGAAIALFSPVVLWSFEDRFKGGGVELKEDQERVAYKEAAAMILSDHPLGVGANHFTFVANLGHYFDTAGEAAYELGRAGNVHNIYFLVAAETGYFGLITFVFFIFRPLTVAFRYGLRRAADPRGDVLLGLGVALLAVYVHSWEEWIFITFDAQYLFAMAVGLVAGLAQDLRSEVVHQIRSKTYKTLAGIPAGQQT